MPESPDRLRITSWFGERDRVRGRLLADELADVYARHEVHTSIVLRARSGFGAKHHLESEALEALSLDLPLVSIAMDTPERIDAVLADVTEVQAAGMVTVERVRALRTDLVRARFDHERPRIRLDADLGDALRMTVHVGRQERTVDGRSAWSEVVRTMHDHGVAGATVLLGIDGTVHGQRARARFLSRNRDVPMMVVAVGRAERLTQAVGAIGHALRRPRVTAEAVRICRRDGQTLARPQEARDIDAEGRASWQELTVYGSLHDRHEGRPLHQELVRRIREVGGGGATTLEGVWGYHGDDEPHGDRLLQVRRRVPLVTTVVERPSRIAAIFDAVADVTRETGLVTSTMVPVRHSGPHDGDRADLRRTLPAATIGAPDAA